MYKNSWQYLYVQPEDRSFRGGLLYTHQLLWYLEVNLCSGISKSSTHRLRT